MDDKFKQTFKNFKSKLPLEELRNELPITSYITKDIPPSEATPHEFAQCGLYPSSQWQIYSVLSHPGLTIIRNPFTKYGQYEWVKKCLCQYPSADNLTNLDVHGITLDGTSWWQLAYRADGSETDVARKLRWVTLGYHHNWNTKIYTEDRKSQMPPDMVLLCHLFGQVLSYNNFNAEAAIVNYYHMDSTLAPHTDHSEVELNAPLFSFSFGQSAVFLVGGANRSEMPISVLLHSGDVLIMSDSCRLAYHAVPRIFHSKEADQIWGGTTSEMSATNGILNFMRNNRINVNVRQVLPPGMHKLSA